MAKTICDDLESTANPRTGVAVWRIGDDGESVIALARAELGVPAT